jgi:DNA repair protein RecO
MHNIYNTRAIILKSVSIKEANKIYFLLTEDFGFIKATAQGIRLSKSKLKGHLQDFYISNISLVKGREFWRIINSEVIRQSNFLLNKEKMFLIKNIFSLILRLVHGEEKNEKLFECINNFYCFIQDTDLKGDDYKNLEAITVFRILNVLGYLKKQNNLESFIQSNNLDIGILNEIDPVRKEILIEINSSLKETQL